MSNSDRWAVVMYVLVLLLVMGVGGFEYYQYGEKTNVQELARKEKDLKSKADALRVRAAAAEKNRPQIAAWESQLLKADAGNYYGQLLLDGVANQRLSGAKFPQYAFAEAGAVGKFPRFSVAGSASGSEEQVLDFIRRFEEGNYKVQIPTVTFNVSAGQASASLTLVYTATEPQGQPTKK